MFQNERVVDDSITIDSRVVYHYWCRQPCESMLVENKKYARPGDMVEYKSCGVSECEDLDCCSLAIVLNCIDEKEVPPVYLIMRSDGCITKEWADDVDIVATA